MDILKKPIPKEFLRQEPRACGCVGPQDGEPLCPCMMANRTAEQIELHNLRKEIENLRRRVRAQEAMTAIIN